MERWPKPNLESGCQAFAIAQGQGSEQIAPNFDVIVYDALNSPILWVEDDPDTSEQGSSRAVPAEYVKGVLEVKSSFEPSTVSAGVEHLSELAPLMSSIDEPSERYKKYLPPDFFCGLVFYELRKAYEFSEVAMSKLLSGFSLRGFIGGLILRGEGHTTPESGLIRGVQSKTPIEPNFGKRKMSLLSGGAISPTIEATDGFHIEYFLQWAGTCFSWFAFDLLAIMEGTYEPGRISSFDVFG